MNSAAKMAFFTQLRTLGRWGRSHMPGGMEQRTLWMGPLCTVIELRYKPGAYLPPHRDRPPRPFGQLHVVVSTHGVQNDTLRIPSADTKTWTWDVGGRRRSVVVFRPDRHVHCVCPVTHDRHAVVFAWTVLEHGVLLRVAERCGVK